MFGESGSASGEEGAWPRPAGKNDGMIMERFRSGETDAGFVRRSGTEPFVCGCLPF